MCFLFSEHSISYTRWTGRVTISGYSKVKRNNFKFNYKFLTKKHRMRVLSRGYVENKSVGRDQLIVSEYITKNRTIFTIPNTKKNRIKHIIRGKWMLTILFEGILSEMGNKQNDDVKRERYKNTKERACDTADRHCMKMLTLHYYFYCFLSLTRFSSNSSQTFIFAGSNARLVS